MSCGKIKYNKLSMFENVFYYFVLWFSNDIFLKYKKEVCFFCGVVF